MVASFSFPQSYFNPYNLHQESVSHFSYFSLLNPPLLVHKIILTIPTNTPFLYISAIVHLPTPSLQATSKEFPLPQPFSQFRVCQGTNEQGSIVRTDTDLSSLFFLKAQTGITGITTTDSLSLVVSDEDACNQNGKPFNSTFPLPSTYCH